VQVAPKIGMNYLGVNVANPVLADPRVRQAIFYALDRARVHQVAGGNFGTVTTQPWGPSSPAFDPAREAPLFDPSRARTLLSQAGFRQQAPLAIEYPAGVAVQDFQAQIIQDNLRAVGVTTELQTSDAAQFTAKYRGAGFRDFWIAAHGFADLTPLTLFEQTFEFGATNVSHYESPRYQSLVSELVGLDPASTRSIEIYRQLNQLMIDEPWVIPTGVPQIRIDLVGKRARGWPATPADYVLAVTGKVRFADVSLT
jgi:peptide/nickel transport system substrate-binding protein